MKGKLNQKTARSWAGSAGKVSYLWDESLRGFGLRVNPTGGRFWVVRFSVGDGETQMMTLGRLDELTAEAARELSQKALQDSRAGLNPRVERDKARKEPLFDDLVERFRADVLSIRTKQTDFHEKNIRKLLPEFKGSKVKDLSLDMVDRWRTIYGPTAPVNFNRCLSTLSTILNHAEIWGMRPIGSNPCQRIKRFKEESRERLLTGEEIERLGVQIRIFRIMGGTARQLANLVELILLTGARVNEFLMATWGQVDVELKGLFLTDSKTGKGKIHLPDRAIEILESMGDPAKDTVDDFLFPGRGGEGYLKGYHLIWDQMRIAAGIDDVRIHDLRHVLASYSHRLGASDRTVADLLRHKKPTMTHRYIQGFNEDQKSASERTAVAIGDLLGGGIDGARPTDGSDSPESVEDV